VIQFLRASLSFAWLDLKALQFYPMSGVLQIIQSFVNVGIWFFVSLFLQGAAHINLEEYGGSFVAYVVVGVLFFQSTSAIMSLPHQSLSTAFWDKRLEIYHGRSYGLWAFLTGRFLWAFVYQSLVIVLILIAAMLAAGVSFHQKAPVIPALLFYVVFVLTCFGIGLAGASNFFTLEVKQGREPLTWLVDVLARIFSGVYYPLTILPPALVPVSLILPHTYALDGIRRVMINGTGFGDPATLRSFVVLVAFCVLWLSLGSVLLRRSIDLAEKANGIGIPI
jgi:ABC-2 type transport system permease protein